MSFILDALRKSEHERQQKSGPGLAEIPPAPRKPKTNVWATAAIALLIVNLVAVGVLLLRRANPSAPAAEATTTAAAAPTPGPAADAADAPATAEPAAAEPPQPTLRDEPPPAVAPGRNPLAAEVSGGAQDIDAGMAASAASVPAGPPAVSRAPGAGVATAGGVTTIGGGTVRYEPIPAGVVERAIAAESRAAAPATPSPAGARPAPQEPALPGADEISASGGVPALHLDLHVYSSRPAERFIFVNSHRYREGDTLQEGPTVEQITQAGAVLSYRGNRFLLSRN